MQGKLLFLGTGSSAGIPMIGCKCAVCLSSSAKNKRFRPAALLEVNGKKLLIDASPDFREQALKYDITNIDGLLLTHAHYDHIGGLDELRIFYLLEKKHVPCLLSKETLEELKRSYYYLFCSANTKRTLSAQFDFLPLEKDVGEVIFQDIKIGYLSYFQKEAKVTGYKIGDLAYVSDIKEYSEDIFTHLRGVNTLIVSALRENDSPMHFNLQDALAFAKKVNAKKTYFTHIAHDIDHEKMQKTLPQNIYFAYDGLEIEFFYER